MLQVSTESEGSWDNRMVFESARIPPTTWSSKSWADVVRLPTAIGWNQLSFVLELQGGAQLRVTVNRSTVVEHFSPIGRIEFTLPRYLNIESVLDRVDLQIRSISGNPVSLYGAATVVHGEIGSAVDALARLAGPSFPFSPGKRKNRGG